MTQKILQVNGRLVVPVEEFEQHARAEDAQFFTTVPGLVWKIWLIDRERGEAGGIYLFEDEVTHQAYVDGPVVAQLREWPLWADLSVKGFDYLAEASAVTHAPVGEGYRADNVTPVALASMAE